jgi:MoaA/NifB/PqqE/SkfB family radical SAM enzyme
MPGSRAAVGTGTPASEAACYVAGVPDPVTIAERIRRWPEQGVQGPLTLELYPTLRCNLDCRFCDTTDRHRPGLPELSPKRQLALLDEAAALGVKRLFLLGGGEPLAAKALTPKLMAKAKALGMEGILTTNGTLLGAALREQVVATGWDEIHFSIDGPSAAIHDQLRGRPGCFQRVVTNICRLRGLRDRRGGALPRIALHFVLTRLNFEHLSEMVQLGHTLGAFRIDFDALIAYQPEQLALALEPHEQARVPQLASQALALAERLGIATTLEHFLDTRNLERGQAAEPSAQAAARAAAPGSDAGGQGMLADLRRAPCLKAWHYIVVQADGRTSPCCVLAGQGESLEQRSLVDVWRSGDFLERIRSAMLAGRPPARCSECSANILAHERVIRELV